MSEQERERARNWGIERAGEWATAEDSEGISEREAHHKSDTQQESRQNKRKAYPADLSKQLAVLRLHFAHKAVAARKLLDHRLVDAI